MTSSSCNNLFITKAWQDTIEPFFAVRVRAISPLAEVVHDGSYTSIEDFQANVKLLSDCIDNYPSEECVSLTMIDYSSPGVILGVLPRDSLGHLHIEIDLPIMDICDGTHRAKFFIETELGQFERFMKRLNNLPYREVDYTVELHEW